MEKKHFHLISTPFFALLGRVGGIVIPLFVAFYFGVSHATDAFFLAFSLILSLAAIFAPIFEALLVPYLAEHRHDPRKVSSLSNGLLLITFPCVVVVALAMGYLIPGVLERFSGLDSETAQKTGQFFFEMLPLLLFWILVAAGNSILFTYKTFWYPALSPLIRSLCAVLVIVLLHSTWQVHAATRGLAVGEAMRWLVGLVILMSLGKWKAVFDARESGVVIRQFLGQTGYQIVALLAINLLPLTDQWFASWLSSGSISLMSYADRLFQIPYQLAMSGFLQVFLTYWSESYIQDHRQDFWKKARRDIRMVFWVTLIFSLLLIFFRQPVIWIVYGHGDLTTEQLRTLTNLFAWLMVGFVPAVVNLLYLRLLYVMKKSSVFCLQSLIRLVLKIIFNYVLMRMWGLVGLAISTALVYIGSTLWLHRYLLKHWEGEK